MGKVVKTLAVIAVAAAVAYFAPQLSAALIAANFSVGAAAAITAVASLAVSAAAAYALQAVSAAPSGVRMGTKEIPPGGFNWVHIPPTPPNPVGLRPIEPLQWWRAFFWPWQRFAIIRLAGDCMNGSEVDGAGWALIDRLAVIQPGSLFAFDLTDLWSAYKPEMRLAWLRRLVAVGMVKRYLGVDDRRDRIVYELTNPATVCDAARENVRFAYAVVALAPSIIGIIGKRLHAGG